MNSFVIHDGILEKYVGSASRVVIPSGVQEIGIEAFRDNSSIISVVIPEGIKHIKALAFRECTQLEEVSLPDGLETIGVAAFYHCTSLKTVIIPNAVVKIGSKAFSNCSSLKKVILPSNVRIDLPFPGTVRPAEGTFNGCTSLRTAGPYNSNCDIEYGWVDEIPVGAFYGSELSEVIISDTIKSIESLAFKRCGANMIVTLPSSCELGEKVFDDDVSIRFSARVLSKDKISANMVAYANSGFFDSLSVEEIAWIILYQSKKWKIAVLNSIKNKRALDVLEKCYAILDGTKKVTKAIGTILLEILNEAKNDESYLNAALNLKEFLILKKCTDVAELVCIDSKQSKQKEYEGQKIGNAGLSKLKPCDEIAFGRYPQNNPSEPTPITWIVLAKEENSVFLVSKKSLAIRKYHEERKKVSWARSDLRQWLNDTFMKEAFSDQEQAIIETVNKDKVTLLTTDDIKKYIIDIKQIVPKLTEYACIEESNYTTDSACAWWLRLPIGSAAKAPFVYGIRLDCVEIVGTDFSQFMNSDYQVNYKFAVRPALWLSI